MKTIVAIATGITSSGISIIRLSGENAFSIAQNALKSKRVEQMENRKMYLCNLTFGDVCDKGLVVKFVAPNSFTGENVVEFHLHGSVKLAECAVEFFCSCGAELASKGEFSKRAFLNGKLSLEEAEAVTDLINSESKAELNASFNLIVGKLKQEITSLQDVLTDVIAEIDVAIDYPEEDISYATENQIKIKLEKIISNIKNLLEKSKIGVKIKNGVRICLVGKPNVGKSSLLNALLNYDKAIVTEIAGTTRDVVEGSFEFNGVKFNIFDTAGIRESCDKVESIGIEKSKNAIKQCDIILCLLDVSTAIEKQDQDVLNLVKTQIGKPIVMLFNKSDIAIKNFNVEVNFPCEKVLNFSTKQNSDVQNLKQTLFNLSFNEGLNSNELYISNERHIECLKNALKSLENAVNQIGTVGLECLCLDVKNAWNFLGEVTGKYINEEVLDAIFSKFCLGK